MALDALVLQHGVNIERHAGMPVQVFTGTGLDPRSRLRVDPAQTSFFEGREFRVWHEFNVPAGQSQWLRFTVPAPLDVSVHGRDVLVVQGNLRFCLCQGTGAGAWTPKVVHPVNARSDRAFYIGQVTCDIGGTVSQVVEKDVMILETGGTQASSVSAQVSEQGLASGVYFVEIRNTGSSTLRGLYRVHWEEAQPRSPKLY